MKNKKTLIEKLENLVVNEESGNQFSMYEVGFNRGILKAVEEIKKADVVKIEPYKKQLWEIRIVSINFVNEFAQKKVLAKLAKKSEEFKKAYIGYIKIEYWRNENGLIYIDNIEPIRGTINDYHRTITGYLTDGSVF